MRERRTYLGNRAPFAEEHPRLLAELAELAERVGEGEWLAGMRERLGAVATEVKSQ